MAERKRANELNFMVTYTLVVLVGSFIIVAGCFYFRGNEDDTGKVKSAHRLGADEYLHVLAGTGSVYGTDNVVGPSDK